MNKQPTIFEIKNPVIDSYHLNFYEAIFHNANGYLGVRYSFEEDYPEDFALQYGQYINGFYDLAPINQPESLFGLIRIKQFMLNIANTQTINLKIGEDQFSMLEGTIVNSSIKLDMKKGITTREVGWISPKGHEIKLTINRMASFYLKNLFTIEYILTSINYDGEITITSGHDADVANYFNPNDPRNASEMFQAITTLSCEIKNGGSIIHSATNHSELEVTSCVKNFFSKETTREFLVHQSYANCVLHTEVEKDETVVLTKYCIFTDSIRYEDCKDEVCKIMENALKKPLTYYYNQQEKFLNTYWKNCSIGIDGDNDTNLALQYNLFQLIQSVGKDKYCSIAPKGLSGEGYEGQYFWDTEIYIQPFLTITNPELSLNLIDFRYNTLPQAKDNAQFMGHEDGALFPWRTIMGKESSGYYPAGSAQYHINGDIAHSVISYYLATNDDNFLMEKGAEIIFETARIWINTGNFYKDKFHINSITGPDEYTCVVNNNYYTNISAKYHLNWAIKIFEKYKSNPTFLKLLQKIDLKEEELKEFKNAADKMYLPYDEELKITPQDDSFLQKKKWDISEIPKEHFPLLMFYHPLFLYRHQICKQADTVLAHFLFDDAESEEVIRNSFLYYEKITTHDSSLSRCIFSIMAARLGYMEKAISYFGDTIQLDIKDSYGNTRDGIHTANMGGNYMVIVYGFGGFKLKEEGIFFAPVLPEKWNGYFFSIFYHDRRIRITVKEKTCTFTLKSGEPVKINVYNKEYLLDGKLEVPIKK